MIKCFDKCLPIKFLLFMYFVVDPYVQCLYVVCDVLGMGCGGGVF